MPATSYVVFFVPSIEDWCSFSFSFIFCPMYTSQLHQIVSARLKDLVLCLETKNFAHRKSSPIKFFCKFMFHLEDFQCFTEIDLLYILPICRIVVNLGTYSTSVLSL